MDKTEHIALCYELYTVCAVRNSQKINCDSFTNISMLTFTREAYSSFPESHKSRDTTMSRMETVLMLGQVSDSNRCPVVGDGVCDLVQFCRLLEAGDGVWDLW